MDFLKTTLVKFRNCFRSLFPYNTDSSIELVDALSSNTGAGSVEMLLNKGRGENFVLLVMRFWLLTQLFCNFQMQIP